jgi:flagellar protein FliS
MNSNPYKKYQTTHVTTASKEKILLMLYEGAIRFNKQAKAAMLENKIAEKGTYISKTTAILSELLATLDFKIGGQLAADLENLYVFMIDKLIEGNVHNKVECLEAVDGILNTLYQAWKDVIENPRADGIPSPKLQPEEYKKYIEQGGVPADQSVDKLNKVKTTDNNANKHQLKIVA